MTVRSMLETAIDDSPEDGTARFSELDKVLVTTPEIDVIRARTDIANLQLSLRYFRIRRTVPRSDPSKATRC